MHAGDKIKELRKQRNMTQEQLGELLGVKKAAVQKYEKGDIVNLKAATIRELCNIFNVNPSTFIFPDAEKFDEKYNSKELKFEVKMYESIEDIFGESALKAILLYDLLNEEGQTKTLSIIDDMASIDKYRKH